MTKTITLEEDEIELLRRHVDYLINEEESEHNSLEQEVYAPQTVHQESRKRFKRQSREMMKLLQKIRSKL